MNRPSQSDGEIRKGLWRLPLALTVGLLALSLTPRVHENEVLYTSFWAAAALLVVWQLILFTSSRASPLRFEVSIRKQHYIQATLQLAIFVYWGWYWRPVYDAAELIVGQLLFAYVFDMLLGWTRRGHWRLGFGPFPIIFSTNLFLWFRDDWFYLQFLMVGVGFLGKEFVKWNRDGRLTHIFNPSAFSLGLFSLVLILTDTTELTVGPSIPITQFYPPHMYVFLFGIGLVVMYFFAVTPVAASAAMALFGLSALYSSATGVYYFFDSEIPVAVFLGLHLLVTDPSTSPRTYRGRVIFGVLYGFGVFALYSILGWLGAPTFYDKLLCVPLLNLSVRAIDRFAESKSFDLLSPPPIRSWMPKTLNLAHMAVWVVFFGAMTAIGAVGDTHPGHYVPFWQKACDDGLRGGCQNLVSMESIYCERGSGWACNELGVRIYSGSVPDTQAALASTYFDQSCDLGFEPGCGNGLIAATGAGEPRRGNPRLADLQLLVEEGKGPLPELAPVELYARSCNQGWASGCANMAQLYIGGEGVKRDAVRAADGFRKACEGGVAAGCANLGLMYRDGDGVAEDRMAAVGFLEQACGLGLAQACVWLQEEATDSPGP